MIITKASQLPNLRGVKHLATDCETRDPNLFTLGPGDLRGDGEVLGVALSDGQESWYVPLNSGLPQAKAVAWLRDVHANAERTYYGANLMYDMGWYAATGFPVKGPVRDVLHAGRLLDLWGKYPSLDELLTGAFGSGKTGNALWEWLAVRKEGEPTRKAQIKHLAEAPPELVGEYACGDVSRVIELEGKLRDRLRERSLEAWYLVEERLLPLLVAMRARGVRCAVKDATALSERWQEEYDAGLEKYGALLHGHKWRRMSDVQKATALDASDPLNSRRLGEVYASRGITVPRTATGLPSIRKEWLAAQGDHLSLLLRRLRSVDKLKGTYVDGLLPHVVKGWLHPTLKQLWPRTLRMSCENPNEQSQPKRDEELAPLVRGLWLPDQGEDWGRADDSQQEYRLLVSCAVGDGAEAARQRYRDDPDMDFHQYVADLLGVKRDSTLKNTNFSKVYRAGKARFAATLGVSREEGDKRYAEYDERLPFVSATARKAEQVARQRGFIKLLFEDARIYFDRWEVADWDVRNLMNGASPPEGKKGAFAKRYATEEEAQREGDRTFAGLVGKSSIKVDRAGVYTAINSRIQPSGAQRMKLGLLQLQDAGIYGVLGVPLVSVHDEWGFSVPRTRAGRQAFAEVKRVLDGCTHPDLHVPLRVGLELGADWGHLKGWEYVPEQAPIRARGGRKGQ